jgi:hypothetical protein
MVLSLAYDEKNKRVLAMGRTDPPYQFEANFSINDGESEFGLSFEQLTKLRYLEIDADGRVVKMIEHPEYVAPSEHVEIPKWLRKNLL